MRPADDEVLIVGAGAAGCAAAIVLASAGVRVRVLDRARVPGPDIDATLPPKLGPLLEVLGVRAAIDALGFVRVPGVVVRQDGPPEVHDFDPDGARLGWQAERPALEGVLLERARAVGAIVELGVGVRALSEDGTLQREDGARAVAAWVIDASGRGGLGARSLGLRARDGLRTLALTRRWQGARPPDGFPATSSLLETRPEGWLWSRLDRSGARRVSLGVDAGALGGDAETCYRAVLASAPLHAELLEGARPEGPLQAHDASWSWSSAAVVGRVLLAGDAASVIDPLCAQGVLKAIQSGMEAAAVARTALRRPEQTAQALAHHARRERERFVRYAGVADTMMRAAPWDTPFWTARQRDGAAVLAELDPDDLAAAERRREVFLERLRRLGGQGLRPSLAPEVRLDTTTRVVGGWVEVRAAVRLPGRAAPFAPDGVMPERLLPLLDGRPVAAVFDAYAAAVGQGPSARLARRLTEALAGLAAGDGLRWGEG